MSLATPPTPSVSSTDKTLAINRLMGLAVFGEMVAARTYTRLPLILGAQLRRYTASAKN
jgi:hypothetical protein